MNKLNYKYETLTPFKICVLENFPFIEADFDALTNYQIMCKIVEYLNQTRNNQNIVQENIIALNNWFNNLDVQDEINNKLDAMAESGQLADIIAQYIQLRGVLSFDSVLSMKNADNLVNGSIVKTLGFNTYNDNGGAYYKIRNIINTDIVNDVTLFSLNDVSLVAELIPQDTINVNICGVFGNNTDISSKLDIILDFAHNNNISNIYLPSGTYLISKAIRPYDNTTIYGDGVSTIIKAFNFDNLNSYKCMIIPKVVGMDNDGANNINIKNITLDNNGIDEAGQEGLIQFRGTKNSNIENVNMIVNGYNCWGVILFSSNQNILINKANIDNISADNNLGGCLWIRSGLTYDNREGRKTKNVYVTNSSFSSTAKDELVVITDGIPGGWTEAEFSNLTLNGIAETNYSSYLFIINALSNNGHVKASLNNIDLKGKTTNFAMIVGYENIPFENIDLVANNIKIDVQAGGGIRSYDKERIFNNCNIKVSGTSTGATGITLSNSYSNNTLSSCIVKDCTIITTNTVGCESCNEIYNSTIKASSYAINGYGDRQYTIVNNRLYSDISAIRFIPNGTSGANNSIVIGNYLQRLTNSDNAESVGIFAPYIKNSRTLANRILGYTTGGSSYGFKAIANTANSTNYLEDNNSTYL